MDGFFDREVSRKFNHRGHRGKPDEKLRASQYFSFTSCLMFSSVSSVVSSSFAAHLLRDQFSCLTMTIGIPMSVADFFSESM